MFRLFSRGGPCSVPKCLAAGFCDIANPSWWETSLMKKVKIGFWLIVVAFLVLVGVQNKAFFLQQHSFDLDLWVTGPYHSPDIHNAVLFAVCFLAGLAIAYLSGLFERYKANKTIKQLTKTVNDRQAEVEQLKTEVEALKRVSDQTTPLSEPLVEEDLEATSAPADSTTG
jgi:hypothetical protein